MKEQVLEILTDLCPGVDFEQETDLIEDGIIDSLDIVSIVTELMDVFHVEISVDDLTPEHFASVDTIVALVQGL